MYIYIYNLWGNKTKLNPESIQHNSTMSRTQSKITRHMKVKNVSQF